MRTENMFVTPSGVRAWTFLHPRLSMYAHAFMECALVNVESTALLLCHEIVCGVPNVIVAPEAEIFVMLRPELVPSHHLQFGVVLSESCVLFGDEYRSSASPGLTFFSRSKRLSAWTSEHS